MELVVSNMKPTNNNLRLVLLSGDWIPTDLPDKIRKTFGKLRLSVLAEQQKQVFGQYIIKWIK